MYASLVKKQEEAEKLKDDGENYSPNHQVKQFKHDNIKAQEEEKKWI